MARRKSSSTKKSTSWLWISCGMLFALSAGYLCRAYLPVSIPLPNAGDKDQRDVVELEQQLKSSQAEVEKLKRQLTETPRNNSMTEQELADYQIKSMLRQE